MKTFKLYAILLALVLVSCQSLGSLIEDPRVSFNSVDIAGIGLSGVNLIAHVDVENPNSFSIPMPKVDWELFINNTSFIDGVVENNQIIGGKEKVTMSIPINVGAENLFRTFSSLIGTRETSYNIVMGLRFPIPLLEYKVFERNYSGVLPLQAW